MTFLLKLAASVIAVFAAARIIPGVEIEGWQVALIVAVVLGVLNLLVKPVLVLLTLPATLLSFGLFLLVINAVVVLLADRLVPGFSVVGFWHAMLFSVVVSLIGGFLGTLAE